MRPGRRTGALAPFGESASAVSLADDLPGGATRLFSRGMGIDAVLVGGTVVARDGAYTDDRSGRVLRSGRDPHTPDRSSTRERTRVRA